MWGPPVISWFRFAPVTIVISTIKHSYWSYVHQLNAIVAGGLTTCTPAFFRTPGPSPEALALLEGKTVGVIQSLGSYGIFWLIELDDGKILTGKPYISW